MRSDALRSVAAEAIALAGLGLLVFGVWKVNPSLLWALGGAGLLVVSRRLT